MLLPSEIAEQLTPDEMMELEVKVIEEFDQAYGIVSIKRKNNKAIIEVELQDQTHHEVKLG